MSCIDILNPASSIPQPGPRREVRAAPLRDALWPPSALQALGAPDSKVNCGSRRLPSPNKQHFSLFNISFPRISGEVLNRSEGPRENPTFPLIARKRCLHPVSLCKMRNRKKPGRDRHVVHALPQGLWLGFAPRCGLLRGEALGCHEFVMSGRGSCPR